MLRHCLITLVGPLMAAGAFAQETEPAADPAPPVTDTFVVYGAGPRALEPAPAASRDVLFADDFTGEAKQLADLLEETEGVFVRRFGGPGDRSEVSIRGSGSNQVVVTLDGVRANSVLTGGLDLSRVCLPLLERVEITRGAGTTQEGSGAIGGVVNLVTRNGLDPVTRAEFSGGAFDTYAGSFLHADRAGVVDYSVGYCGFDTEGDFEFQRPTERIDGIIAPFEPDETERVNNDRRQHGATFSVGAPFAQGMLRLSNYAVYASGGQPGVDSGNGVLAGQSTEARSRDFNHLGQLRWQGISPTGFGDELEIALHHRYEWSRFRDPMRLFAPPIDTRAELTTAGARVADGWKVDSERLSHHLRLYGDFAHDTLEARDQRRRRRAQAAGALEETLALFDERLVLSGGLRVDWADGFEPKWLPSGGLILAPWEWLRLRGQASRAYRVPTFDELFHPDEGFIRGNPNLRPEDAWNYDASVELRFGAFEEAVDLRLRGGWFRREIEESIVWVLINPRTTAPVNTGEAVVDGFEASAKLQLTRWLRLTGSYTDLDGRRDTNRQPLPGQPEYEGFARAQLGPEHAWKLVGEIRRVGEILVNEGGSRRLPDRTVWNASAALNLAALPGITNPGATREFWVFFAIDNIGDESVRDAVSFPRPGRNARAGVELRWW